MKLETPTSGSELTAEAVAVLEASRTAVPPSFVRDLFGRVPREDLATYSAQALADLAIAAYDHLQAPRAVGAPDLRLVDIDVERNGRRREVTVLEVVNDNMPFLLDSTLAELGEQGHEPLLVAHPILAVERGPAGALVRLDGEATISTQTSVRRESFIHIHVDRIDEPQDRERLIEGLRRVYADVAIAVRDWPGMRGRIAETIQTYRQDPPPLPADEISEAIAFLEWIAQDNFTFLGLREY